MNMIKQCLIVAIGFILILLFFNSCKTMKTIYDEYDFKFHLETLPDNRLDIVKLA